MKTIRKLIHLLSLLPLLLCFFSCSLTYEFIQLDNIGIGYSKIEKSAFIGNVSYKEGDDDHIVLPSSYNNITIKDLGGYFGRGVPTPFGINIYVSPSFPYEDKYITLEEYIYDQDYLKWWNDYEIISYKIYLTLPDKLKNIKYTSCKEIVVVTTKNEDDTIHALIYRPVYYLIIDESNPYFYTEDGKLYNKQNNQLYEDFLYE
ncbi:MAG: hypothetical protein ACI4U5_04370 [Bacilli bacterium]